MTGKSVGIQSMAMSRRSLLKRSAMAAGVIAVPSLLQACAGGASADGSTGTVRYIKGPFGEDEVKWVEDTAKPFLEDNPDIELRVSLYDWASRDAQMSAAYASGSPPDVVYLGDALWVPFAGAGAIEDISDRVQASDFAETYAAIPERFWAGASVDGKTYGVPLYSSSSVNFVNVDLMREAGVTDWTSSLGALRAAAAQVKERTGEWGYATTVDFGTGAHGSTILPALWSSGTTILDESMTTANLNTSEAAAQLENFRGIYVDDKSAPAPGLYDAPGLAGLFTAGKVAIYTYFTDPGPSIVGDTTFKWELTPMPPLQGGMEPATYVAVGSAYISARSDVKGAAWEVVKYLSSKEAVDRYRTFIPAVYGCRDDLVPSTGGEYLETSAAYYEESVVPYGNVVPSIPNAPSAMRGLCEAFEQLCTGEFTSAQAAEAMNDHVQSALEL